MLSAIRVIWLHLYILSFLRCFFFQAEDGIRVRNVTGVQTCALPIWPIIKNFPMRRGYFNSFRSFVNFQMVNPSALNYALEKRKSSRMFVWRWSKPVYSLTLLP